MNGQGFISEVFLEATEAECNVCIQLAFGGVIDKEAVMPLPKFPGRNLEGEQVCRDCQAADTLAKLTSGVTFKMARAAVGYARQQGFRSPAGLSANTGLSAMTAAFVKPCCEDDFEPHLNWLKSRGILR